MKQQIFTQKISTFIFMAFLLVFYSTRAGAYGHLEFTEGRSTTRKIAENAPTAISIGEPLRYTIGQPDDDCIYVFLKGHEAEMFDLAQGDSAAYLRVKAALDYETKNVYEVLVVVVGFQSRDAIWVKILVTNVNEAPVFSESIIDDGVVNFVRHSIPENTPAGVNIGLPVSATDPDDPESVLTYRLGGRDADMFEIESETGQLLTKVPFDYEAFEREPRSHFVAVEASDGIASAKTDVRIDVEPVNEFDPMFREGEATTRKINETAGIGVNVGEPLIATDMDAGETLEYSLADVGAFEVDNRTGQLRTIAELDYETKPVHNVQVIVSDGERTGSITVTVQVLTTIVEIPDSSLAWAIRRTLGLADGADITKRAMSRLTSLRATSDLFSRRPVPTDLTGLEHATNLRHLNLNGSKIDDLTPIAGLTTLTTLALHNNNFSSLTPLANLRNLTSLDISANGIRDITVLRGLTNLNGLFIHLNEIQDITPLKGLTKLDTLHLSENSVKDITTLASLTNLTRLFLQVNSIQNITPLEGLTNLETLYLSTNNIEDITVLESLTKLRVLHLSNNRHLTDIGPLAGLVNLEILRLSGCPIEDFSPLAGLTANIDINVPGGSAPVANRNATDSVLDLAVLKTLDRNELQARLQRLYVDSDGSLKYQHAIAMIQTALASMRPDRTMLLTNYPNPFNPETWIPYHLGKAANVEIAIYDTYGTVIRHLELGHQSAGYYTNRNHAAYWDGKNDFGERVASGIYFYQMQADTISPLRKMVILK